MKLDKRQQALLIRCLETIHEETEIAIIVTNCCDCGEFIGVKDGKGTHGISSTYCPSCYPSGEAA